MHSLFKPNRYNLRQECIKEFHEMCVLKGEQMLNFKKPQEPFYRAM